MKVPRWQDFRRDRLLKEELQHCLTSQLAEQQRAQRTPFGEGIKRLSVRRTQSVRSGGRVLRLSNDLLEVRENGG
jgi:hypothetical protein